MDLLQFCYAIILEVKLVCLMTCLATYFSILTNSDYFVPVTIIEHEMLV